MSGSFEDFLDVYDEHRVQDQLRFYKDRMEEYERAVRQTSWVNEGLLLAAGLCGVGATVWTGNARWFGLAGAGLGGLAGLVLAWSAVIGFAANSELYRAARAGLTNLRAGRPDGDEVTAEQVATYVTGVEEILLGEVRSWAEKWGKQAGGGRDGAGGS